MEQSSINGRFYIDMFDCVCCKPMFSHMFNWEKLCFPMFFRISHVYPDPEGSQVTEYRVSQELTGAMGSSFSDDVPWGWEIDGN